MFDHFFDGLCLSFLDLVFKKLGFQWGLSDLFDTLRLHTDFLLWHLLDRFWLSQFASYSRPSGGSLLGSLGLCRGFGHLYLKLTWGSNERLLES